MLTLQCRHQSGNMPDHSMVQAERAEPADSVGNADSHEQLPDLSDCALRECVGRRAKTVCCSAPVASTDSPNNAGHHSVKFYTYYTSRRVPRYRPRARLWITWVGAAIAFGFLHAPLAQAAVSIKAGPGHEECYYHFVPGGHSATIFAFASDGCELQDVHIEVKVNGVSETHSPTGESWLGAVPVPSADSNARVCASNYNENGCTYFVTSPGMRMYACACVLYVRVCVRVCVCVCVLLQLYVCARACACVPFSALTTYIPTGIL